MTTKERVFECDRCAKRWSEAQGTGRPQKCPSCGSKKLFRISTRKSPPQG